MDIDKVKERFLNDVAEHEMEVIYANGINRHLRFSRKGSSVYYFGLVTWNGHLCIYGDMGTSVFNRIEDMFCFFRMSKDDFNNRGDLSINPGYWHEKLLAISRPEGSREFSKELFNKVVKEEYEQLVESNGLDETEAATLWEEIEDDVLNRTEDETDCIRLGMDFKSSEGYEFVDFWEHNFQEYTHHFIWQLYAIVWGISIWDKSKKEEPLAPIEDDISNKLAFQLGV